MFILFQFETTWECYFLQTYWQITWKICIPALHMMHFYCKVIFVSFEWKRFVCKMLNSVEGTSKWFCLFFCFNMWFGPDTRLFAISTAKPIKYQKVIFTVKIFLFNTREVESLPYLFFFFCDFFFISSSEGVDLLGCGSSTTLPRWPIYMCEP